VRDFANPAATKRRPLLHRYLYKASWRGTSFSFWIDAPNGEVAQKRAERQVAKMEGRYTLLDLDLIREERRVR